jgi:hypothetical protein
LTAGPSPIFVSTILRPVILELCGALVVVAVTVVVALGVELTPCTTPSLVSSVFFGLDKTKTAVAVRTKTTRLAIDITFLFIKRYLKYKSL